MISYRAQLAKIGMGAQDGLISYLGFFLAPVSLREAMRSMDFPGSYPPVNPGEEWDKNWTDEVQGCAFAHNRWFFVSNSGNGRRLHVFDGPSGAKIQSWNLDNIPPPDPPLPGFSIHHVGAIVIEGDQVFIDHWCDAGGQILVLTGDGATLNFSHWIPMPNPFGRVGMIAINFARRKIITSGGELNISRVFLHSLDTGEFLNKSMDLDPRIFDQGFAQGGFWSPNNHLYISSGEGGVFEASKEYQYIYCYSPLNGKRLGAIPVRSAAGSQELEGCCFAPIIRDGQEVFIHVVLLENEISKDDIFLKSFSADHPELI
jgi:hypothetical protein